MKIKAKFLSALLVVLMFSNGFGQDLYNLWEGQEKPYYKKNNLKEYEKESWGSMCVFDVTEPTLTIYRAKGENSGKAVIVLPGGGYSVEAIYHEGYDVAKALADQGITGIVLKYRLPNPQSSDQPWLVPLTDTRKALKLVREMSAKYGIDKDQLGVVGFSAGSHLATVACLWESEDIEEHPNFSGLIYGVTNLNEVNKKWLEESLYFRKMTMEEVTQNTLLELVSKNTPPAFLVHAYDDEVCLVNESTDYAQRLKENDVMVEMHLFPKGGHGFGMGREEDGTNQWVQLFIDWVKRNDF